MLHSTGSIASEVSWFDRPECYQYRIHTTLGIANSQQPTAKFAEDIIDTSFQNGSKMMLTLTNNTNTTMSREGHSHKTLESEEPKKMSLLVDYSKRKAAISATKKSEVFDTLVQNRPLRPVANTVDDALALSSNDPLNESLNLEDVQPVQQVSFRVRKSSIRRTKSMDERNISSYDHLQNSIRSALLMQDDDENDDNKTPTNDSESSPKSPTPPQVDRRQLLANARRKNQSMRNLSTHSSAAAVTLSPLVSPAHIPRRIKAAPKDALSKTTHGEPSTNRRASLLATKSKCTSCRHMMRRTKSHNDSTLEQSSLSFSLHGGSNDSHSPLQCSSIRNMKGHTLSRRSQLSQSLSRRHLMEASMANLNDSSGRVDCSMDASMIFGTGPRIRRHGNNAF